MINLNDIEQKLESSLNSERLIAAEACKKINVPESKIRKWINMESWSWRLAAIYACFNKEVVDLEILNKGILDKDYGVQDAAAELCCILTIPTEVISEWIESNDWRLRRAAMCTCTGERYSDIEKLLDFGLADACSDVIVAAAKACKGAGVPFIKIREWAKSKLWPERLAAIYSCIGRVDIYPLETIEKRLTDCDKLVSFTAIESCRGIPAPRAKIINWAKSDLWQKRAAAMAAAIGRSDVPEEVIESGTKDKNDRVRKYAYEADQTGI